MSLTQVILDPKEVATEGRIEIALGPLISEEGIDWGDQQVRAFMAEGQIGEPMIDYVIPNRTIKIPLVVKASEGISFDDWRVKLEAKVAKINEETGWLKRVLPSGRYVFADLVEAKLHLGGDWLAENKEVDKLAVLELQAYPDFYGAAVETTAFEGTGDASTTIQVKGNLPARVESLTVTDKSGNNQRGLLWHFRAKNYSSASTAKWAYNAEELELLDLAEKATLTGSAGTKVVKHPSLSTSWTPILGTTLSAGTFLTHKGLYDVWARVYTTNETPPWLRLLWDVGDIVSPGQNPQVQVPLRNGFYLVNLGQVNLQKVPVGSHRWKGIIQGRGENGGENVSIDRLYFHCADESSGALTAPVPSPSNAVSFAARDEFIQEPEGNLEGKSLATGGTWAEASKTGAKGFQVYPTLHVARRTYVTEADTEFGGCYAIAGENKPSSARVSAKFSASAATKAVEFKRGVFLRYQNTSNWVMAFFANSLASETNMALFIIKNVAGTKSELGGVGRGEESVIVSQTEPTTVSMYIGEDGQYWAQMENKNGTLTAHPIEGHDSDLAIGGALAEGKAGFYDEWRATSAMSRYVDGFIVLTPEADAVMYANKIVQVGTGGIYRQSSDGAGCGPVSYPGADLPRLPGSGPEERAIEVALKGSRGNFSASPDSGRDKIAGQLTYRPCWSYVPSS